MIVCQLPSSSLGLASPFSTSEFNDQSVSSVPLPARPLLSDTGPGLGGVLFVIGGDDLTALPLPLAQGQLFTARELLYTCVPREFNQTPEKRKKKKMSLLPCWCQVMDFMSAGGVQVKNPGQAVEGDLHGYGILTAGACKRTDSHEKVSKEGGGGGGGGEGRGGKYRFFSCRACLFVVRYCCVRCKPERPCAANSSITCSPAGCDASVISVPPIKNNISQALLRI